MAKQLCVMLEKQQKLFVQDYYLKVHDVKETRKHSTIVIISYASQILCDVISRSGYRLSFKGVIHTLLNE